MPDKDNYDFGKGAGFYLNATQEPWAKNYQMEDYIAKELKDLVVNNFPVHSGKIGLFGHSMGGHGALTLYLKYPEVYKSASAFAPICAPVRCPWGQKAFSTYLDDNEEEWKRHDATELMMNSSLSDRTLVLIDQGLSDNFLEEQLYPDLFEHACHTMKHPIILRRHSGYDHSYFFIQSFIEDHLRHHHAILV